MGGKRSNTKIVKTSDPDIQLKPLELQKFKIKPKRKLSIWNEIRQYDDEMKSLYEKKLECEKNKNRPDVELPSDYLNRTVFPILLPALKSLCESIRKKKTNRMFNGIDYISEILWNTNPKHTIRQIRRINIFEMKWAKTFLYNNPRPIYPLSWIWTKEDATIVLQSHLRGYNVRKKTEVIEMRTFWKAIKNEKKN